MNRNDPQQNDASQNAPPAANQPDITKSALDRVRIVLVEPAGPLNVGSVARVMKNMGLRHLVLVNPHCDHLGEEARLMAVHAPEILETAQVVPTVPAALVGCQRAIATTGRALVTHLEHPRTALPWLLADPEPAQSASAPHSAIASALLFGPEDRGLNNTELNYAQRFVYIPTHPDYPSMNLAQAVGICCYELAASLSAIAHSPPTPHSPTPHSPLPHSPIHPTAPPAALDLLEGYYGHLETVLLKIGYLMPHTAPSRMAKFRRLFNRAYPSAPEIALLRGILTQVEWAIQHLPKQRS